VLELDVKKEVSKAIVRLLRVTSDGVYVDATEIAELLNVNNRSIVREIAKVLDSFESLGLLTRIYGKTLSDKVYFVSKNLLKKFEDMVR